MTTQNLQLSVDSDMYIRADTADELYYEVIGQLYDNGGTVSPRGMATKEVLGATLKLELPEKNIIMAPARNLNYPFSVAEWLWVMLGFNSTDMIVPYNRNLMQFSDSNKSFNGAYGPKFIEQLDYVMDVLEQDPSSRQAVITLWRERPRASKDIPCTIMFQFMIRYSKLFMTTYMRSNDAWLGLPYDLFTFTQIQRYIAMELGYGTGTYTHMVGSLHLYETNFADAKRFLDNQVDLTKLPGCHSPDLTPMPGAFKAMYQGLTVMARDSVGSEEIKRWILPNASSLSYPWNEYILLLAYKFHKDVGLVPDRYQKLILAQRYDKLKQAAYERHTPTDVAVPEEK